MSDAITPMMQQYRRVRRELPEGTILFFRLGDFYEMFFEDALEASRILDIALTKRNNVPMCGVPYHAADLYLAKLIRAGRKVAVCDQLEDASQARGIVRRDVTRIVTPGTAMEEAVLESKSHNYLAGLCRVNSVYGLAMLDLSTGTLWLEETEDPAALRDNLQRCMPSECVLPAEQGKAQGLTELFARELSVVVSPYEDWPFDYDAAYETLTRHFGVRSLEGYGCEGRRAMVGAAGGVLHYVREQLRRQVSHIRSMRVQQPADFVVLDEATVRNLDLVPAGGRTVPGGRGTSATVLGVLDVTRTPMGARLLRDWLLRPSADLGVINGRHDAVDSLCRNRRLLSDVREALAQIRDLERTIARLGAGGGNARDLRALGLSLGVLPGVAELVRDSPSPLLKDIGARIVALPDLAALIDRGIVEEPPLPVKEGGMIQRGYHAELDTLREAAAEGKNWLAEFQAREQTRTGIKTLKVRHNRVFGYYIEVSKGQLANVPAEYLRKQTVATGERYITPELKEYENRILGAQERAVQLEYELFVEIRSAAVERTGEIQATAQALAELDAVSALADRALALRYVRPAMSAGDRIRIRDGRHPVVEQMPDAERFVPNDTLLDGAQNQIAIITGPNMAGKSTYIRQVALIVIMAQAGSFVPAAGAEIGVVDRVFTRVGASDDLSRGRSTFMVEMQETANILNNATPRSLVVLDEIGRGTSTFDGISIAWAVAEYLHNHAPVKAKTLFATHYHELTDLALTMGGVKNYNVLVREQQDRVVFLRKIVPGSADKSYGIQVGRLAGLPLPVVDRAKEILANLEEGEFGEAGQPKIARQRTRRSRDNSSQLDLFNG